MNEMVSIVAPAFNHDQYVKKSLLSVAKQDYLYKELIIIDDGSTDQTVDEISEIISCSDFRSKFPGGITFLRHPRNVGAHQSINEGLRIAKGKYLTMINTDDLYEDNRIGEMVNKLSQERVQLAFSKVKVIDAEGKVNYSENAQYYEKLQTGLDQGTTILPVLLNHNVTISTGNIVLTRELFNLVGEFNDYKYIHDWDFVLRAALITEPIYVPSTSYLYRIHAHNTFSKLQNDEDAVNAEVRSVLSNIYKRLRTGCFSNENIRTSSELNTMASDLQGKLVWFEAKGL